MAKAQPRYVQEKRPAAANPFCKMPIIDRFENKKAILERDKHMKFWKFIKNDVTSKYAMVDLKCEGHHTVNFDSKTKLRVPKYTAPAKVKSLWCSGYLFVTENRDSVTIIKRRGEHFAIIGTTTNGILKNLISEFKYSFNTYGGTSVYCKN